MLTRAAQRYVRRELAKDAAAERTGTVRGGRRCMSVSSKIRGVRIEALPVRYRHRVLEWDRRACSYDAPFQAGTDFLTSIRGYFLPIMSQIVTHNAAAALLGDQRVRLLSAAHVRALMTFGSANPGSSKGGTSWGAKRILDVGAGSGDVTREFRAIFDEVVAVEVSASCRWRLAWEGIADRVESNLSVFEENDERFDVVAMLNVLDRCDDPEDLLVRAKGRLKRRNEDGHEGRLLVAVAYPWNPFSIEGGDVARARPQSHKTAVLTSNLLRARSFEDFVASLCEGFFEANGLTVETISRLPYACKGARPLDCAILVLKRAEISDAAV